MQLWPCSLRWRWSIRERVTLAGAALWCTAISAGKAYSLDYREKAPGRATQNMYLDSAGNVRPGLSISGHLASGVPGSVDGMAEAHKRFGKLTWAQVVQPAIDLAEKGFALTERDALG